MKKLIESRNLLPISHPANLTSLNPLRHIFYVRSFHSVAGVIETLLVRNDARCILSSEGRLALRSALAHSHHFAAVILSLFYEHETLLLLCDTPEHIESIYSEHARLLSTTADSYPQFRQLWIGIKVQKNRFRHITRCIATNVSEDSIIIHRMHDNGKDQSLRDRRVVLDPINPDKYADDSKFYTMRSEDSYIVGQNPRNRVECHIFISVHCPLTDAKVKDILANRTGTGKPNRPLLEILAKCIGRKCLAEKWFLGAHVVNLRRIRAIREWMDEVTPVLKSTLSSCQPISRSPHREDPEVAKKDGCRMVAMNVHFDQQGSLQAPHNFRRRVDEEMKFELMKEHDHILDGVVLVKSCFRSVKLTLDYKDTVSLVVELLEDQRYQAPHHSSWYVPILDHN